MVPLIRSGVENKEGEFSTSPLALLGSLMEETVSIISLINGCHTLKSALASLVVI